MHNTEVIVEGFRLDVKAGLDFSFNYQVSDIRRPETRSAEFSKTVQCPGTANNNQIFGHVYDVNIANPYTVGGSAVGINFNPNKKAGVQVLVDGMPVFDGIMQLRRVIVTNERIDYEVVFIGRLSNIFTRLADYKLNGSYITNEAQVAAGALPIYARFIDCSDLDHDYTRPVIIDTWTAPIGEGIVYPLIDYGTNTLFYSDGKRVYHVEDMRPAIYLKDVIDRIFAYAQCTYESSFFADINGTGFRRLILPLTATPRQTDLQTFKINKGVQQKIFNEVGTVPTIGNESTFDNGAFGIKRARLCFDVPETDILSQWPLSAPSGTPVTASVFNATNGNYQYFADVTWEHRRETVVMNVTLELRLATTTTYVPLLGETFTHSVQIEVIRANGTQPVVANVEVEWDMFDLRFNTTAIGGLYINTKSVTVIADNIDLFAGDRVIGVIDAMPPYNGVTYDGVDGMSMWVTGGNIYNEPNTENLFEGRPYNVNAHLPDVSMKDLLVSVLRMFNLHMTPAKDREDHYIIQTWEEFYNSGTVRDWTYKFDHDSPIELIPMGLLSAREYMFKYADDGDYYNSRYQSTHGRTYGSRRFEIDNDFVPKQTEVSVVFSPTPLANDHGSNRIIPKIYDADISEGARPTDANIRILYYAGLLFSTPSWRFRSGYPPAVGLDQQQAYYPYAGHLNNPVTPTFDLSWGIPFELYYGVNDFVTVLFYTNSNLFNEYHLRQYREIVDKDSKLMVGYFRLTPTDILNLDFRDTILIDNAYWRLNRVLDYNPFKAGLTKVELLKVLQLTPFKVDNRQISGRGGKKTVGAYLPEMEVMPNVGDTLRGKGGNIAPPFQGTVKGTLNEINGTAINFNVTGNLNQIGAGTENVTIIGDGNTVADGLHNVTLISTNNYTATRSNVTVLNNGEVVLFGDVIEGSEDEVRAISAASPIYTIDGGQNTVSNLYADYRNILN